MGRKKMESRDGRVGDTAAGRRPSPLLLTSTTATATASVGRGRRAGSGRGAVARRGGGVGVSDPSSNLLKILVSQRTPFVSFAFLIGITHVAPAFL